MANEVIEAVLAEGMNDLPGRGGHPRLYVIEFPDSAKVGLSRDLRRRVRTIALQSGKRALRVFYTNEAGNARQVEAKIIATHAGKRLPGEWFSLDALPSIIEHLRFSDLSKPERPKKQMAWAGGRFDPTTWRDGGWQRRAERRARA